MTTVLGIWHLEVEGGKERPFNTPASVQITNVAFGEISDPTSRAVVKLTFESLTSGLDDDEDDDEDDDDEPKLATTVLCSLTPGKIEQASVNLVLDSDAPFKFEVTGKNTVYLTGNYIRQAVDDEPSDSEGDYDLDEDAYDLREVSSDSDSSRFEEIKDDEPVKQKRARESDAADAKSPAEKKSKKLKADGGKPVPVDVTEEGKEKKDKKKKNAEEKKVKPEDAEKKETKVPAEKTIAGGIVIEDAKIGTGPQAKKGNTVRMRYVGKLTNGKVFDKNTSGKPFTFHLGKGEVIKGWDEGIVGMQVGGERRLTIPPKMAYGSKKMSDIPANSTLVFEVKLVGIA
ncbi:hypothetical protein M413DRAFT_446370 [Hebeloma cylindrosporum]|uniref:peptidylprolyl isomerase n=1 Tax=Hebeloma cylindrosporum TaxID=76867 RepID=A0A0C3BU58_HEBCY|nr:hypothetical protein M413DRAFT_446370 [Hebeloma cylindrosporum h7]